jgi:hypothetical protein
MLHAPASPGLGAHIEFELIALDNNIHSFFSHTRMRQSRHFCLRNEVDAGGSQWPVAYADWLANGAPAKAATPAE